MGNVLNIPHRQTPEDREALLPILRLFQKFPQDFVFPQEIDPRYDPPNNTFYCLVAGIILCVISTAVVLLRLWVRSRGAFGMDDWVMLVAFLFYCAFNVVNLVAVRMGLGFHIYDLAMSDIHGYLKMQFLHAIFWYCALHLCRCSILHLLLRLAHLQSRGQKIYLRTVLGLSYAFLLACVMVQIFECGTPISKTFKLQHKYDGTCISAKSLAAYAGLIAGHIILDALTIFPPLLILARLPLAPGKKCNLIFLLILGVFTMVFTAIRVFLFYSIMVNSFDLTWNATAVAFWGIMESSLAAIITCLPALNQTMIRVAKRWRQRYQASLQGKSSSRSRVGSRSTGFGISIFERNNIYKGPAKFVSYSADATVERGGGTEYVELGSREEIEREEGIRRMERRNDSLTDITVERSFYIIEERASDVELREAVGKEVGVEGSRSHGQPAVGLTRPAKVARFFHGPRRPSSPTIPFAAREAAREATREAARGLGKGRSNSIS
ncbi:hypothetical protein TWF481_008004 [Arthrobotrys musiformis]|uniref:Rhodopsin domain-containing protein n=1 Tax=Arthrobotrys musiformis TaxID=47236 RepID=A0AAV9W5V6_9PEZI